MSFLSEGFSSFIFSDERDPTNNKKHQLKNIRLIFTRPSRLSMLWSFHSSVLVFHKSSCTSKCSLRLTDLSGQYFAINLIFIFQPQFSAMCLLRSGYRMMWEISLLSLSITYLAILKFMWFGRTGINLIRCGFKILNIILYHERGYPSIQPIRERPTQNLW